MSETCAPQDEAINDTAVVSAFMSLRPAQRRALEQGDPAARTALNKAYARFATHQPNRATRRGNHVQGRRSRRH